jgi:hypothetical protein
VERAETIYSCKLHAANLIGFREPLSVISLNRSPLES